MENHFEFPYGFNNGFHDEFRQVSPAYLFCAESHGVLQVFLAHNVVLMCSLPIVLERGPVRISQWVSQ